MIVTLHTCGDAEWGAAIANGKSTDYFCDFSSFLQHNDPVPVPKSVEYLMSFREAYTFAGLLDTGGAVRSCVSSIVNILETNVNLNSVHLRVLAYDTELLLLVLRSAFHSTDSDVVFCNCATRKYVESCLGIGSYIDFGLYDETGEYPPLSLPKAPESIQEIWSSKKRRHRGKRGGHKK